MEGPSPKDAPLYLYWIYEKYVYLCSIKRTNPPGWMDWPGCLISLDGLDGLIKSVLWTDWMVYLIYLDGLDGLIKLFGWAD